MNKIEFQKPVDFSALEQALLKTAEETGLEINFEDNYEVNYLFQDKNMVTEKKYLSTHVSHRRPNDSVACLSFGIQKKEYTSHINLMTILPEEEIKKYATALYKNLNND